MICDTLLLVVEEKKKLSFGVCLTAVATKPHASNITKILIQIYFSAKSRSSLYIWKSFGWFQIGGSFTIVRERYYLKSSHTKQKLVKSNTNLIIIFRFVENNDKKNLSQSPNLNVFLVNKATQKNNYFANLQDHFTRYFLRSNLKICFSINHDP